MIARNLDEAKTFLKQVRLDAVHDNVAREIRCMLLICDANTLIDRGELDEARTILEQVIGSIDVLHAAVAALARSLLEQCTVDEQEASVSES